MDAQPWWVPVWEDQLPARQCRCKLALGPQLDRGAQSSYQSCWHDLKQRYQYFRPAQLHKVPRKCKIHTLFDGTFNLGGRRCFRCGKASISWTQHQSAGGPRDDLAWDKSQRREGKDSIRPGACHIWGDEEATWIRRRRKWWSQWVKSPGETW